MHPPHTVELIWTSEADTDNWARQLAACPQARDAIVTLHGDLHPRNLLQDERGVLGLIDLDSARSGPALLDLGAGHPNGHRPSTHRDRADQSLLGVVAACSCPGPGTAGGPV